MFVQSSSFTDVILVVVSKLFLKHCLLLGQRHHLVSMSLLLFGDLLFQHRGLPFELAEDLRMIAVF